MDLRFVEEKKENYSLIGVHGEIDLYNVKQLKEKVGDTVDVDRPKNMILDIVDVEYIDSTGLGILIGIKRRVTENGGKFCLVLRKDRIIKLFSITGLNRVFDICSTVEDAVQRLKA